MRLLRHPSRARLSPAGRALALCAALQTSACVEAACWAGCSEEESDCEDDPEAYDGFARCASVPSEMRAECVESLCRAVYHRCDNQCATESEP